ncbi:endo-1,4-beta-xylanase [Bifidobacterium actinocoloniiforme DSM 22766]|uniref:Endo-1,4-beta-xylanase n=1 Tax=Bifidobacterium actinocoloniiforme DSM 22766 TaxID=1437605 RepID=A0A086YYF1_9BIFI|nr:glycoside hydrolase family 43 protein [Bifidobacterium actinocoloniiforme]AKV55852.1 1,4-beta-xylanase [Bifidobacterium actinocoloniiforme DSM 22766]KFI39301.1 endo-1,4-beta-xylanase [Bifidobacterium actinocoloniiforme DSM 22766]
MTINQLTETNAYLFAHFTGDEQAPTDEQIYFALSRDGRHWEDLRSQGDPVLTWNGGEKGVRDPFIVRGPDGAFHILATDQSIFYRGGWQEGMATVNGSTGLVIWDSPDLVNWSDPRLTDVASPIPGAGMAWAPEASWDDERAQWIVYWATRAGRQEPGNPLSNELGQDVNMYYATSPDLHDFSTPTKWIDRGNDVIDTSMMLGPDGWWYRVSKDAQITIERTRNPYASAYEAKRTDDSQAWSYVGSLADILGDGRYSSHYFEGPELFTYNAADIYDPQGRRMPFGLMCDQFAQGKGYLAFRSADLASRDPQDWELTDGIDLGNLKKRHGSILPITDSEYKAVKQAFER